MSQLNRNVNYLLEVDGITVWERLRVVRNFLRDRQQALKLAHISIAKMNAKLANEDGKTDKFEAMEIEITLPEHQLLLEDCEREIAFLTDLEKVLTVEAEKERFPGKTDEEMYEINFYKESGLRNVQAALSELFTTGRISPVSFKGLVKHPLSREIALQKKLITTEMVDNYNSIDSELDNLLLSHATDKQFLLIE